MTPRVLLIIKFRHIGDVLLISPLITTLRQQHPNNIVCVVVKSGTEAVLSKHPDLDTLYTLPQRNSSESWIAFFVRYLNWILMLRTRAFDLAINATSGDRGVVLSFLIGARERWSLMRDRHEKWWRRLIITRWLASPEGLCHTVLRNLALVHPFTKAMNGDVLCRTVQLRYTDNDQIGVEKLLRQKGWDGLRPLIHLHPFSRWMFKCWRDDFLARVIDWLEEREMTVVITASPDQQELKRLDRGILPLCRSDPIHLGGRLTLKQMAALSSMARLFLGVDSAPMHMAAAVNTAVVALFGPSGSFDWGPWPNGWRDTSNNPYPQKNGIQHAGKHVVIQHDWPCIPCGQAGCDNSKTSACLEDITPEMVAAVLKDRLKL